MKEFTRGSIYTIKGMKDGEIFDPKIFLAEPDSKDKPRYHIKNNGVLFNLIKTIEPFSGIKGICLISVPSYRTSLKEIENLDFFKKRKGLSNQQFLWAMFNLISFCDDPDIENGPLFNKNEWANYLITSETITMFQFIGGYTVLRGWKVASFYLDKLTEEEKRELTIEGILVPIEL